MSREEKDTSLSGAVKFYKKPQTLVGFVVGAVIAGNAVNLYHSNSGRQIPNIPRNAKIQSGYVSPTNIGIRTEDYDGNGERETIATIDGIDYLVKYNSGNKPSLSEFRIEQPRIITE